MNENTGKLILRVVLGLLILLHGISKLRNGIGWLDGALTNAGLPVFLKYGVYVGEVLAPLAVIAGWYSRIGAWLMRSTCRSPSAWCTARSCSCSSRRPGH